MANSMRKKTSTSEASTVAGRALRDRALALVDHRSGRQRVHLLHVGKTGGTALKSAVAPRNVSKMRAALGGRQALSPTCRLVIHGHGVTLGDVPVGDRAVFFVRDPARRFVSGFNSRQQQGRPRYDIPWTDGEREAFTTFETADALASALSDPDPTRRAAAEAAMGQVKHVREALVSYVGPIDEVLLRRDDILMVGRQEHLNESFERFKQLTGFECGPLPTDDRSAHRSKATSTTLSDVGLANITAWYSEDYRLIAGLEDAQML